MAEYLYACQIDVRFPTAFQAETAMRVMQVDLEPGDRILKAFCLVTPSNNISDGASGAASNNNEKGGEDKEKSILRV